MVPLGLREAEKTTGLSCPLLATFSLNTARYKHVEDDAKTPDIAFFANKTAGAWVSDFWREKYILLGKKISTFGRTPMRQLEHLESGDVGNTDLNRFETLAALSDDHVPRPQVPVDKFVFVEMAKLVEKLVGNCTNLIF